MKFTAMKGFIFILLLTSFACTGKITVTEDEMVPDIFYTEGSFRPFSGVCSVVAARDSQVLEEFTYKNGRLEGEARIWYHNGKLKRKGSYQQGKLNGKWEYWDQQGFKCLEACYENDALVSRPTPAR
jgi:antitoxin component YwqK of YwqJK toxin-antitoxin module